MLSSPLPVPHLNEKREIIKIPEAEIIKIIQCGVAGVGAGEGWKPKGYEAETLNFLIDDNEMFREK